ncbi:beta-1,4-mannosyltransferase egh-like [Oppia nitens]|uniref:beta-1,4-mannosyltransferase egh-like n=1 Tax=Oppia nitens TaxID=1686743 RepID=UPI0023D9AB8E|nr:beta-1,4-mannosyltransferase egh-like [Oppia nitens]
MLTQNLLNFFGLIIYNAFKSSKATIKSKRRPQDLPFICIRVVTCGDYPELVRSNVDRNLKTCLTAGLSNFIIEVVTHRYIDFGKSNTRLRQLVIPDNYQTKSGVLFKGRSLQYCLENGINKLDAQDWIIHLDEETVMTKESVYGICNFIVDGRHQFGQGTITYVNNSIVNWWTTLADCGRVAYDMGLRRSLMKTFHIPLYGWNGSYMVVKFGAEQVVTFDHGVDSSVSEDSSFALHAYAMGYTFDSIDGDMYEQSPFTVWDQLRQRRRWIQGTLLTARMTTIPLKYRLAMIMQSILHFMMPIR